MTSGGDGFVLEFGIGDSVMFSNASQGVISTLPLVVVGMRFHRLSTVWEALGFRCVAIARSVHRTNHGTAHPCCSYAQCIYRVVVRTRHRLVCAASTELIPNIFEYVFELIR